MKYHSSLIKKYISINDTPEHIAQKLIVKTCEIEEIIERNISDSIVIGYVTACEKHPDADKLNVCQVNCGDKGAYQIICGGSNVRTGIYVPVALPGTVFEKLGMTIEKRTMRGLESNGMICSKEELGINEDQELHSIRDLQLDLDEISDNDLGTPIAKKFSWLNSVVFDVDNKGLTSRPDLTGHFGIAIELNAMYRDTGYIAFNNTSTWMEQFHHTNILDTLSHATPAKRNVIGKANGVNSYTLLEINNISLKPMSFFTRLHMIDMGANPRNNWVDFSNLFMLLTGQPIHFFDADKVNGDIIVRNADDGETFIDLFETQHILKSTDIVIADKDKILALAGVVGGLESGVSDTTKNILVEIANFDPVAVRKTGTRLSLRTDAELRYEKSINPWWTMYCLLIFLDELKYYGKDLGNFELGGISSYVKSDLQQPRYKTINVDFDHIEKFIFGKTSGNFPTVAKAILNGLGFSITDGTPTIVTCPIRRSPDDLNIQEDIVEEIIRIYGYECIESLPVLGDIKYTPYIPVVDLIRTLEDIFVQDLHFNQTETYPWTSEKLLTQFGTATSKCYSLQNPTHPETPFLRDSMIYGLLQHAAKNSKFFDHFNIFDIGNIWKKDNTEAQQSDQRYASSFVHESPELGVLVYEKSIINWDKDTFLTVKSLLNPLFARLGIIGNISLKQTNKTSFHPKKQANILLDETVIGTISSIHPLILKEHKIPETAGLTYLSISLPELIALRNKASSSARAYETLQDQIVWRDLCFVVDTNTSFEAVLQAVKNVQEISNVEVFDAYEGSNLGDNKKSVSLKIKIMGDGSFTTEQINAIMDSAIKAAESVGGKLR